MGLRPGKCYRKLERPYTRQSRRKPRKSYVKGAPDPKIRRFEMGNPKKEFSARAELIAERAVQIRHNALEAMRIAVNKKLEKELGKDNFFFKIFIYPFHVLRENPLATGAGADRFQTGMRLAFGKPIGTAARVRANQRILEIRYDRSKEQVVKKAMQMAASKLPTPCKIAIKS